jgi:hypothetical protein
MVENPKPLTFLSFLPAAILLALIGWVGLAGLVVFTLPTLGPRWLFFFLGVIALTGTSLPAIYFLNRRFPSNPPPEPGVLLRQAVWIGVYGGTLAWLQLGRMLSPTAAAIIAGALVLIEGLLRMREISRWKPGA